MAPLPDALLPSRRATVPTPPPHPMGTLLPLCGLHTGCQAALRSNSLLRHLTRRPSRALPWWLPHSSVAGGLAGPSLIVSGFFRKGSGGAADFCPPWRHLPITIVTVETNTTPLGWGAPHACPVQQQLQFTWEVLMPKRFTLNLLKPDDSCPAHKEHRESTTRRTQSTGHQDTHS